MHPVATVLIGLVLSSAVVIGAAAQSPEASLTERTDPDWTEGLEYESLGVGVLEVIGDGAGHDPREALLQAFAFEPDGGLLVCCWVETRRDPDWTNAEIVRLGDRDAYAAKEYYYAFDMAVAPDGRLWSIHNSVHSLDGHDWSEHRPNTSWGSVIAVQPDGTAWAAMYPSFRNPLAVARYRDGKWTTYSSARGLPRVTRKWDPDVTGITSTPDGSVWVGVSAYGARRPGGLLRFDGKSWKVVRPLGRGVDARVEALDAAPDGSLWVYLSTTGAKRAGGDEGPTSHLARFDGKEWKLYGEADGVPPLGPRYAAGGTSRAFMEVGPDGTVWLTPVSNFDCHRLVAFDGSSSTTYLGDGACIRELAVGPDGAAWVAAEWVPSYGPKSWNTGLVVIRPGESR